MKRFDFDEFDALCAELLPDESLPERPEAADRPAMPAVLHGVAAVACEYTPHPAVEASDGRLADIDAVLAAGTMAGPVAVRQFSRS